MADDANKSSPCIDDEMTSSEENDAKRLLTVRFIAPVTALIVFNLIVIVGNSLVIAAVFTYRKLRTVTNTFIVSLAVSDLLLGAVVLPFSSTNEVLGWWPFGRLWCSAWLAIDVWVCTASILNLCAISLDRYLAISRPFRYPVLMSPTRAKVAVAIVWMLALAICLPPLLGWKDSKVADVAVIATTTDNSYDMDSVDYGVKTASCMTGSEREDRNNLVRSAAIDSNDWMGTVANDHTSDNQGSVESSTMDFIGAIRDHTTRSGVHTGSTMEATISSRRRIANDVRNKHANVLVVKSATTSPGDNELKDTGRKMRRDAGCSRQTVSSAKEGRTTNWVTALPADTLQSTASFNNACGLAATSGTSPPVCVLTSEPGYIIYSACGSFWIPMLIMVSFYLKIYRTAVKATNALSSGVLTKKTGRITSSSDESAVNLRVHRGGGGARTSGGNWMPPSNRLSDTCESSNYRSSQYGTNVDEDADSTGNNQRSTHGTLTPEGGCFRRQARPGSSCDRNIPTGMARSGRPNTAVVTDELCRNRMTNGAADMTWSKTSTSSRESSTLTSSADSSQRRPGPAAEANVIFTSRRRRVIAKLTNDSNTYDLSKAERSDEGVESLLRSTLTPVFEQCSASPLHASATCDDVELVDATQVQGRRGFVHIRTQLRRLNREKKAAKTVGVIVGCFVLCWTPFFSVYVLGVFCADCTPPIAFVIFFWLGYCNSAINPFVYALCSKDFRDAFRRLLRCGHESRRYGSNSTLAVLISGLRTPAPRRGSQSVIPAVQFSAVHRR